MNELVSVIIPVYNAVDTIEKTVNSIINQTYKKLQIILVNDGSTDDSKSILERLALKWKCIEVYSINNSGPAAAREYGLVQARGKYVSFCDADDTMFPKMVETLVHLIEQTDVEMAICNYCRAENQVLKNYDIGYLSKQEVITRCISDNSISGFLWNKLFLLSIIRQNDLHFKSKLHFCEDLEFVIQYCIYLNKAVLTTEQLYLYQDTLTGLTNSDTSWRKLTNLDARLLIQEVLRANNLLYSAKVNELYLVDQAICAGRGIIKDILHNKMKLDNEQWFEVWRNIEFICRKYGIHMLFHKGASIKLKSNALIFATIPFHLFKKGR